MLILQSITALYVTCVFIFLINYLLRRSMLGAKLPNFCTKKLILIDQATRKQKQISSKGYDVNTKKNPHLKN